MAEKPYVQNPVANLAMAAKPYIENHIANLAMATEPILDNNMIATLVCLATKPFFKNVCANL